jgi:hypothetical protein
MNIYDLLSNSEVEFAAAIEAADEIQSSGLDIDLLKDDRLDELKGVPFLVVGGSFREKVIDEKLTDFVTVIAMVADEAKLKSRHIQWENKRFHPMMTFGFNDGGTGVRRQLVAWLHEKDYISVTSDEIVESGTLGQCSYDKKLSEWDAHRIGELTYRKKNGTTIATWEFMLEKGLFAPRGIRTSTYKDQFGKDRTTRYLG